jgi:indoleamine 2,3-dioxygenase
MLLEGWEMLPIEDDLQETSVYWSVTDDLGFLPYAAQEPHRLAECRVAELVAAESLAQDLPRITDNEFMARVWTLGETTPDIIRDLTPTQAEAAARAYTFVATRIIHDGHLQPDRTLDARVARPLWWLAQRVRRAPCLTYATYVLANWQNPVRRRTPPEDFEVQTTFTGTPDEAWFVAVHLAIESVGGEIIDGLARCERGITEDSVDDVTAGLAIVESALLWSASVFPRIEERLDATVFTEQVRKYLFGYQDVRFDAPPDSPMVSYIGETGAQSGAIRAADAGLGVAHSAEVMHSITQFLSYAPPPHRLFLKAAVELGQRFTRYVRENPNNTALRRGYQDARVALGGFRETHLATVKKYLVGAKSPYPEQGTGGTQFQNWLRQLAKESIP